MLEQYSLFVEILREFNRQISDTREAMNQAIDYCIEHGILEEILRKNRGEILGSLLETFDKEKYEKTIREEGYEAGRDDGYSLGREEGYGVGHQKGREEGYGLGRQKGREEGYSSGKEEKQNQVIYNMLLMRKGDDEIISITECTKEDIAAIRQKIQDDVTKN